MQSRKWSEVAVLRIMLAVVAVTAFHATIGPGSVCAQAKKKARITIGKDTTFFTEPVNDEGYINYVAALDRKLREGVTAENNANVPIRLMLGERELSDRLKGQYYALLGIPVPEDPQSRLCLLYTSPSPRDRTRSRMPSSA